MERYETAASLATSPETRDLLAAIGLVVDQNNKTLYSHTAGYQSLVPSAPQVSPSSNAVLGSAGKFITHIAALQLVEMGLIGIDDPVASVLKEFENVQIISSSSDTQGFTLRPATKKMTLRHLLTHTSGLSDRSTPLIQKYQESSLAPKFPEETNMIVKLFSIPLLFEPGEGWEYGCSIHWLWILVSRLSPTKSMIAHVQEHIFKPLGMTSSSYTPQNDPEIRANLLQMVSREESGLVAAEGEARDLVCSVPDLGKILSGLISPSSKILSLQSVELLFTPQLSGVALSALRNDTENYAAPAGIPPDTPNPPINFSAAGALMVVEGELPLSKIPKGTVTWNGMPNLVWAMNRDKGVGMVWATQLLPVDDPKAVELIMEFMRCAWEKFGS